jgi:hypothetical protein
MYASMARELNGGGTSNIRNVRIVILTNDHTILVTHRLAGRTFVAPMERPGSDVGDRNAARAKETGFAFHALKGFPPRPESGRHNLTGCSVLLIT